jgi:hypothetical protein
MVAHSSKTTKPLSSQQFASSHSTFGKLNSDDKQIPVMGISNNASILILEAQ